MKLLVAEDAENYVEFIHMELEHSRGETFQITAVDRLDLAIAAIQTAKFDAALLDLHLPDSQGLATLKTLREKCPNLPIVVLTGCADETVALQAVESGAQDYLLKDRLPHGMLARSIRYAVYRHQSEVRLLESQQQLRQAQKMEAVGRLAGGVAHDFNNMLTVILGYCSMLMSHLPEGSAARADIEEIKKTSERAAELTKQLLTFSRRRAMRPVAMNINQAIQDIELMVGRLMSENVAIKLDLCGEIWPILADPGHIAQVIMNLAVNARDAMPKGGTLSIGTQQVDVTNAMIGDVPDVREGPYVQVSVRDTGSGMTPDTLSHLFEPFFTTKEEGKGTGLGLSIVYGVFRQSGGFIRVESAPGSGTEFKIYLPKAKPETTNAPAPAAPAVKKLSGHETILLVEDEEPVRALTARMLREQGYQVIEARHGQEAVALGQQAAGPIHMVLADVIMPKMSGLLVAQLLKHMDPSIKTLFMTGHAQDETALRGIIESGSSLLMKPFTVDALVSKVREVLDAP